MFYLLSNKKSPMVHVLSDMFCFQSKSIGDAVYEVVWYNMPSSDSRIVLFMIVRCQKRLTITAGRVVDLTFEGFTSVRHCKSTIF